MQHNSKYKWLKSEILFLYWYDIRRINHFEMSCCNKNNAGVFGHFRLHMLMHTHTGSRIVMYLPIFPKLKNLFSYSVRIFLPVPGLLCVRHDEKTWSLERTDSVLSDCPSGVLSSSVGTSKCSSPACMEARARRVVHCGYPESRRPPLRYGDSFDSLDSPHSDRWPFTRLSLKVQRHSKENTASVIHII